MHCFPFFFFFFNDTATTEIYTLSLHDALPIYPRDRPGCIRVLGPAQRQHHLCLQSRRAAAAIGDIDRKSTRLNSSHANISYAVFCLKKKKKNVIPPSTPARSRDPTQLLVIKLE